MCTASMSFSFETKSVLEIKLVILFMLVMQESNKMLQNIHFIHPLYHFSENFRAKSVFENGRGSHINLQQIFNLLLISRKTSPIKKCKQVCFP